MRWVRAWIEGDGVGYHWYAIGEPNGGASEAELGSAKRRPAMDLTGWIGDRDSAMIVCTQAQVRWFLDHGEAPNQYITPSERKDE